MLGLQENVNSRPYDIFIAYRRRDGSDLAKYLRLRLQSFKFSSEVIEGLPTTTREGARRKLRVYLDVAYERATDDFFVKKVIPALDGSKRLAVISTPTAFEDIELESGKTGPNWLCREIDHFLNTRGEDARENVFVVLGPGAPENVFPGRLNDSLRWDWVDFRGFKRFRWLTEANDAGLAKLVAGLYELPDELLPVLRREERNRRRRLVTIAILAATLVAALTTVLAVWALKETQVAEDRSRQALIRQSQALAALAELKSAQGDQTLGSLLALNALPNIDGSGDRPFTVAAEASLYRSLISAREKHVISVSPCNASTIAFSASGQSFATGCFAGNNDARVLVFDAASGKVVLSLPCGNVRVDFVFFLVGDRFVGTGSSDGTLMIWDATTGSRVHGMHIPGVLKALAADKQGHRLISVTDKSIVTIWDAGTGKKLVTLRRPGDDVRYASFSETGDRVLTASYQDGKTVISNATTGEPLQDLAQSYATNAEFFAKDQRIMTSGGNDGILWRMLSGRFVKVASLKGHINKIESIAASGDAKTLATCSFDGTARMWDAGSGKLLSFISLGDSAACFHTGFSPDSSVLATVDDHGARVWRVPDGAPVMTLISYGHPVTRLSFAPDGKQLVTSTNSESVSVWDIRRQPNLLSSFDHEDIQDVEWEPKSERLFIALKNGLAMAFGTDGALKDVPALSGEPVTRLDFLPSVKRWVRWTKSGSLSLVSESEKDSNQSLTAPSQTVSTIAVNRNIGLVAGAQKNEVLIWRAGGDTTKPQMFDAGIGQISTLWISPPGNLITAVSKDKIVIWNILTAKQQWNLGDQKNVDLVRFSDDGFRMLTGSEGPRFKVWDLAKGRELCSVETSEPVLDATFDPQGLKFAIGTELATFILYDAHNCRELRTLDRAGNFTIDATVRFSKSGRRLLTAAGDGLGELWDVETGTLLQSFENAEPRSDNIPTQEENSIVYATFNEREDRAVLASDHRATTWLILPEGMALIKRAGQLIPRDLLPEEVNEFGLDRPHPR
jgi:WD40 repeat protein